jgi:magnesium-protoporphyrin IX monomethyl ester (oxidative) cyclase
MGLRSSEYDYQVFRITSQICRQVFPVELDIDHPVMRAGMDKLVEISAAHQRAKSRGGLLGWASQAVHLVRATWTFGRMFLVPVKSHELPQQVRVSPVW